MPRSSTPAPRPPAPRTRTHAARATALAGALLAAPLLARCNTSTAPGAASPEGYGPTGPPAPPAPWSNGAPPAGYEAPPAGAPGSSPGPSAGGAPALAAPGPALAPAVEPEVAPRFEALRASLAAEGFAPTAAPVPYALPQGGVTEARVPLRAGDCFVFATFGGAGVYDSDVFVLDPGTRRALRTDTATAVDAQARLCPSPLGEALVRVRAYAGSGAVWLAVFARANGGASVAAPPGANGPPGALTPLPPYGPAGGYPGAPPAMPAGPAGDAALERSWGLVTQALGAVGLRAVGFPLTQALPAMAAPARNPVRLLRGRCYAFAVAVDGPGAAVELTLRGPQGEAVGEARGAEGAVLRACARREGVHSLDLRAPSGDAGRYRLGLFEQPR